MQPPLLVLTYKDSTLQTYHHKYNWSHRNHKIWFCCMQTIKVQTRLDRPIRASKQSDQRICYSISKTLIAYLAMRIIQIEPSLCNRACWMCPYRVANP